MCSVIFVLADDRKIALFLAFHRGCLMHFDTPTAGSLKLASSSPALEKHGCLRAAEELQPARSSRAVTNQRFWNISF
jgi:hypothetical protein